MIVRLSELDTYEIAWASHDRWKYKQDLGIISNKVDTKRDEFAITTEGMAGEWAVGKVLGIPVNLDLHPGGDPGWDFDCFGYRFDVKTTRAKYLLFRSVEHFKADIAVLARYLNHYQVELVGAINKADFLKKCQVKDFGYGDNYVVDPKDLDDIREFI